MQTTELKKPVTTGKSTKERVTKTYTLLDHLMPTAPIYAQVGPNQKIRLNKLKNWSPFLQATIIDSEGESRVIRLKLGAKSIYQDEQIAQGIPANAKFSDAERKAVKFINSQLVTDVPIVQEFLEASPQFQGFKGSSPEGMKACFKIYNRNEQVQSANKDLKLRIKAANKIVKMDLETAQEMLIRINGSHSYIPETVDECQNELATLIDASEEALQEVLRSEDEITVDEEAHILIGKLINIGVLSFDAIDGEISVKRDDQWQGVKALDSSYKLEDREKYFVEFLTTEAGQPLLDDLKALLEKHSSTQNV